MINKKRTNNGLQNTTQKTKDRVTGTPLKTKDEWRCSGKVGSSCFIKWYLQCYSCHKSYISYEWRKDRIVITTNRTRPWSSMRQIFRRSHVDTEEHPHILYFHKYHGNKDIICTTNIDCWSTASGKSAHGEV